VEGSVVVVGGFVVVVGLGVDDVVTSGVVVGGFVVVVCVGVDDVVGFGVVVGGSMHSSTQICFSSS